MTSTRIAPMRRVAAGTLRRGSLASPDEQPEELISLSEFSMDQDPVTNVQFAEFIADGGYCRAALWTPKGWEYLERFDLREPNYWHDPVWNPDPVPVTGVSWWEALAFARWADKTLPTEAQWEYACKGPEGYLYPWGDDAADPSLANYAPEGEPELRAPTEPGHYPRNVSPCGCRDLAGNFAEWCLDTYVVGYKTTGPDPLHFSDEGDHHVVRGGCGLHDDDYLRCSARDHYPPGLRDNLISFRCVTPSNFVGVL